MDERVAKIERELGAMNASLAAIVKTLDKMSDIHVDTRLLEERWQSMDQELVESFARIHKRVDDVQARLDEEAKNRIWAMRVFIGAIITAVASFIIKGGLFNGL